jgi:hypothetical protein
VIRKWASLAVVLALGAAPTRAAAEPSDPDRALATELFKEGRALMNDGKIEEACARFEESQRLDAGGGTLLNVALCHEALGKTATAWSELVEALGIARRDRRDDRIAIAEAHIAVLEPKLARIVVVVPDAAVSDGLALARDGSTISRTVWGLAMPVDPGSHHIEASAPGKRAALLTVEARPGETTRVEIPTLEDAPAAAEPAPSHPEATPTTTSPVPVVAPRARTSDAGSRNGTILGYGLGVLGVASIAVGSGFGIDAINQRKQSDEGCPGGACTQPGVDANERAKHSADISTVTMIAGALCVGVGVYLIVVSRPSGPPATAALVIGPSGLPALRATF